jgi:argininosuccinate lyase
VNDSEQFPAAVYAETVLAVNFADAQRYFLEALLEIHYAHTLMLARQAIIPSSVAARCLEGLDSLDRTELARARFDGKYEDLFFYVEAALERACGPENAGRMHTARSRNDIDITQYRMRLRREILDLISAVNHVRKTLLAIATDHVATIMPGYTHTQPAQPTTLAHYLLAVIEMLGRDERRLQAAFATVNRNPLGACAITTTGFPIDRQVTTDLLGFEGLQLNSFGAIAATDYITETAGAIATSMVNLGKVTQDLLLWCTAEFGFLRLSDAWVQISSIMPQKRNPVAFEHARILASKALGYSQSVFIASHNTPFGDIVDSEDDLQPLVFEMTAEALRALRLFGGVVANCEVNVARMAERANADFLSVTELADTLVRNEQLSFRDAHHIVSAAVRELRSHYSPEAMVDAVLSANTLRTPRAVLLKALDPVNFVEVRRIPGGPAIQPVRDAIQEAEAEIAATGKWLASKTALLASYPKRIEKERQSLFVGRAILPAADF